MKAVVIIAFIMYLFVLITYHRFEDSKNVLAILGDIPTTISALATSCAVIIALITYISNLKKMRSKTAYDAYKEALGSLNETLASEQSTDHKLYFIGVCFESLIKIERHVTENEHRDILGSAHISTKFNIKKTLNELQVNDYLNCNANVEVPYHQSVSSCANALCEYWQSNLPGESSWSKQVNGITDSFASSPYAIDDDLVVKALALSVVEPLELKQIYDRVQKMRIEVTSNNNAHLFKEISDICPLALAYILLKSQVEVVKKSGEFELALRKTYDKKYWICHKAGSVSWCPHLIPEYFKIRL
ncbi:hypothetical protein [Vibrio paracholerae]|uniref:hypothetical protein n=1 Tax=Vibrio paracholerae TaxID=650003 RepID=UPI000DE56269|nr:hypothetical protein [Vibrio paracholerae]RBM86808.1 hypothetical protein DLR74_13730 [Vibrio paracholerae]